MTNENETLAFRNPGNWSVRALWALTHVATEAIAIAKGTNDPLIARAALEGILFVKDGKTSGSFLENTLKRLEGLSTGSAPSSTSSRPQ